MPPCSTGQPRLNWRRRAWQLLTARGFATYDEAVKSASVSSRTHSQIRRARIRPADLPQQGTGRGARLAYRVVLVIVVVGAAFVWLVALYHAGVVFGPLVPADR
jgi:hypothetical protein